MDRFEHLTRQIRETRARMEEHITPEERRRLARKLDALYNERTAVAAGQSLYKGRTLRTDLAEDR
jgi:hypothetical protein